MAHGGHHSGHHHYGGHYYHSSRYSDDEILWPLIAILTLLFIALAFDSSSRTTTPKQPISKDYELSSYILDEEEYFKNTVELRSGLKYLYEKTGVQVVVMSTKEYYSDSMAVDKYNELFNDESHVLIIIPTNFWQSDEQYYAIGDTANTVIDDTALDYLLSNVESSKNGKEWEKYLKFLADKLIDEESAKSEGM